MKILFLAHRTPFPPNKGEKIRAYHILTQLAKRHSVSMAYWVDSPDDVEHVNVLRKVCRGAVVPICLNSSSAIFRALRSLFQGRSFSEGYFYSHRFQSSVDRLIRSEQVDLVYVFSSVMAQFVMGIHDIPTIVDFVDVDSDKWGQMARFKRFPLSSLYRLEQIRLNRYERTLSRWARWNLFVSQVEADLFRKLGGSGSVAVLPNGVDSELRRLPQREARISVVHGRNAPESRPVVKLLFVGTMNYYPNTDAVLYFVREVLPLIQKRYPRAVFDVVGRFPPHSIRKLDGVGGVRVLGEVADVRSYLVQADVSVAPMRIARGVQNKVLEAMSVGLPVVATSEAVKGIQLVKDEEVLIGDNPQEFASQVARILSDSTLYERVASKARSRVVESYSWKGIGAQLNEIIVDCKSVSRGWHSGGFVNQVSL
jgi:polysaccharide biosynthesis protein PslH